MEVRRSWSCADVELVGKIVQFGRGMIEEVSRQMFRQFSTCVRQQLEVVENEPAAEKAVAPELSCCRGPARISRALGDHRQIF